MNMKSLYPSLFLSFVLSVAAFGQATVVNDAAAKTKLVGRHRLSLQWVSWDYFGVANVTQKSGALFLKGEQRQRKGTDFVSLDGRIAKINARDFTFVGKIVTQVSYINGGKPCVRDGEFTFRITGKRRYWRLAEMNNPCDEAADYVDIYFR